MDYNGMVAGVKLMLPVYELGAIFFLGDGHSRQGAGEVVGNAAEVSMQVEFRVDLIKDKEIAWPRLENDDYIMVWAVLDLCSKRSSTLRRSYNVG